MKNQKYLDLIGWSGAIVSLVAYALNTQQMLASSSAVYLSMNAVGCSCLIFYTFRKGAFANTILNSVYLLITLAALGLSLMTLTR